MRTRFLSTFAFALILIAAACSTSPTAPADGDIPTACGGNPMPAPGMICRGDSWSWN